MALYIKCSSMPNGESRSHYRQSWKTPRKVQHLQHVLLHSHWILSFYREVPEPIALRVCPCGGGALKIFCMFIHVITCLVNSVLCYFWPITDCQVRPICPICPISPIFVLYFKKMSYIFAQKMYFLSNFHIEVSLWFLFADSRFKSGSHNQGPSFNVCEQRMFEYTHQYTPSPPMRIILLEEIAVHDLSFRSADVIGIFFQKIFPTAR